MSQKGKGKKNNKVSKKKPYDYKKEKWWRRSYKKPNPDSFPNFWSRY
jgi:hypothetical protein